MKIPVTKPADKPPTEVPASERTPLAEICIHGIEVTTVVQRVTPAQGQHGAGTHRTFNSAV
ncbi:hypothetical protein G3I77_19370 [Streptomyces sp. D2-8]|uniref:hypothetical protein n=1 Tax=Streptomyces sp. D2-8 TaxID=2707767 RepID=UPI0020C0DD70|nr:hypothetical protein [Streptomyces sp. D2-8]MCK8435102.1 hypothetical protein [Streptomyces sp. D2-8]